MVYVLVPFAAALSGTLIGGIISWFLHRRSERRAQIAAMHSMSQDFLSDIADLTIERTELFDGHRSEPELRRLQARLGLRATTFTSVAPPEIRAGIAFEAQCIPALLIGYCAQEGTKYAKDMNSYTSRIIMTFSHVNESNIGESLATLRKEYQGSIPGLERFLDEIPMMTPRDHRNLIRKYRFRHVIKIWHLAYGLAKRVKGVVPPWSSRHVE